MSRSLETAEKMNLLSWMMLVFLLSAGTSQAAVDVNWLTGIVTGIRREYRINGQFCLAANIPQNLQADNLQQVLQNDPYNEDIQETLGDGDVYEGSNVVIAKNVGPVHAEPQVLRKLGGLISNRQNKFLLIYSYLSPCGEKCANPDNRRHNIIKDIRSNVVPNWPDRAAFVFTTVFDQPNYGSAPTKEDLINALNNLGNSGIGLRNIFRCYAPPNLQFQCHSCSSGGRVSDVCVVNTFVPQQGGSSQRDSSSSSDSSSISRKRGRYGSPRDSSISRDSSRDSSRDRGRSTSRDRDSSISRDRGRSTSRDRGSSFSRDSSRDRGRSTSRDRGSSFSRDSSRDRGRSTSRDRGRSTSRDRGSSFSRNRGRP